MMSPSSISSSKPSKPDPSAKPSQDGKPDPADASRFSDALSRAKSKSGKGSVLKDETGLPQYTDRGIGESALIAGKASADKGAQLSTDMSAVINAINRYSAGQDVDGKPLLLTLQGQNWPIDTLHIQKSVTGTIQLSLSLNSDGGSKRLEQLVKSLKEHLKAQSPLSVDVTVLGTDTRSFSTRQEPEG